MSRKGSAAAFTALLRVTPKRRRKIVVHSVPDFEDGALAVLDALLARGHKPLVLLDGPLAPDTYDWGLAARGVAFAEKQSARGRLHYLTAETVFTTHGPFRAHSPAANQRVVYVGHGEPLAKSAGYWAADERIGASVAVASSAIGRAFRCVQQGLRPDAGPAHRGTEKRPAAALPIGTKRGARSLTGFPLTPRRSSSGCPPSGATTPASSTASTRGRRSRSTSRASSGSTGGWRQTTPRSSSSRTHSAAHIRRARSPTYGRSTTPA